VSMAVTPQGVEHANAAGERPSWPACVDGSDAARR
jgi:hypothetical protein